jgi:TetR/AcrR family transcriptional repressor of lmrAB and yxaGH operons
MPAPIASYDEVVARLLEVFKEQGYAGASISQIAQATGLGRSSLYHHFPGGKEDMALAVLARIEASMREEIFAPLRSGGPPEERMRAMLDAYDSIYDSGRDVCLLGTLVLGGSRKRFQQQLTQTFEEWLAALTQLAIEAGVQASDARDRAEDAVVRIQGALILAGGLNDPAPFRRALDRLSKEYLRSREDDE